MNRDTNGAPIAALDEHDLLTIGGGWSWQDFGTGLGWTLGVGCYVSAGNPVLCIGALAVGGINMYAYMF